MNKLLTPIVVVIIAGLAFYLYHGKSASPSPQTSSKPVLTSTKTSVPSPSPTPRPSVTASPSHKPTSTPLHTPTPSVTPTPTATPTATPQPTSTATPAPTATPTPSATPLPEPVLQSVSPMNVHTNDTITLNGLNFIVNGAVRVQSVIIGGQTLNEFSVDSPTSIRTRWPLANKGTFDVTIKRSNEVSSTLTQALTVY